MVTLDRKSVSTVRRPYDLVVCDPHPHGDEIEGDFRLSRDANGNCIYKKVGEKNVQEYIGSFANGCALSSILDRISLMPLIDKVRYLQQDISGVGADLSHMPVDGTEAFIMVQKLSRQHPQIFERVAKGESLDAVLTDIFKPMSDEPTSAPESTSKGGE